MLSKHFNIENIKYPYFIENVGNIKLFQCFLCVTFNQLDFALQFTSA